ncbi:hypothetical protein F2P81_007508 [Scophthalmus maximus]|uniref:Uncharacterized protein n=1 Tax=Scophthalmus maximus TaxID=52904 RepID=A0A6A4SZK0_SCOMX|nr:hypothetical protein F2P81_007508 [Scophthalmus maximus]
MAKNTTDEDMERTEDEDKQQNVSVESEVHVEDTTDEDTERTEDEDKQQNLLVESEVHVEDTTDEDTDRTEGENIQQNLSVEGEVQPEPEKTHNKKQWRKLPVVPKNFTITVRRKKWNKIAPLHGTTKLRQPWTDVLYNSFWKKNPCCTLAFKSQHIKTPHSRKRKSPSLNITAICKFPSCSAKFIFKRKRKVTRSLNKNVLKVISSEVTKGKRIHDNIFMEMYLTQNIMKECDQKFHKMPGYIQHFQVDPFGVHMYTETGISILVPHLRKKTPLTFHLDATGNVTSKVPGQTKRTLYYSFTLSGGQNAPPLPVCEMLTNEHSIPPITFWLMQFLRKLSQYTKLRVHQIETDYSWALIQSVLSSFSGESIVNYVDRAFAICLKLKTWKDMSVFSVLHICSAHVLKAVAQSINRRTADKGLKDFATFAFARLQNTTSLTAALKIFHSLCTVLTGKKNTNIVKSNLKIMQDIIKKSKILDMEDTEKIEESPLSQEEDDEERRNSRTIVGRSPFTSAFQKVFDEVQGQLENEDAETPLAEKNPYFCPGIVDVLFQTYLGIFPLWSGVLLGNLKRYASDKEEEAFGTSKTRDTNCHVHRWFGIVKQSILRNQRRLRPGTFVRKMYGSLQGRYREHIMSHNLSEHLLLKIMQPKDIIQSQEGWAKRVGTKPQTTSSKFYTAPITVPVPKRAKSTRKDFKKNTDEKGSSNDLKGKGSKPATEMAHYFFKQYLHAISNHIFVVDPLPGSNEVEDSKQTGHRFGQYFKMHRNRFGTEDWVDIKWQPGTISHTFQKDGTSCGIFVMQMAKMTVMGFPNMPQIFHIDPQKKSLQKLRRNSERIRSIAKPQYYTLPLYQQRAQLRYFCINLTRFSFIQVIVFHESVESGVTGVGCNFMKTFPSSKRLIRFFDKR